MHLVSVILSCYKQAEHLTQAVESVVSQTFTDWELIIVNDGSPDETKAVAERLIARHADKNIRLVNQPNGGLARSRNEGIRVSKGKYILPLNADDKLHPDFLNKTVAMLDCSPDLSIAYTRALSFGMSDLEIPTEDWNRQRLCCSNLLCYCALFRRTIWEAVGGYNTNMPYPGYEAWNFWLSCVDGGFKGRRLPELLFYQRAIQGSMTSIALEHDAELRAQIVMLHPNLYNGADRQKALATLAISAGEENLRQFVAKDPRNIQAMELLGTFYIGRSSYLKAAKLFYAALELEPDNVPLMLALALALLNGGDPETARILCNQALKTDPNNEQAREHLNIIDGKRGEGASTAPPYVAPPQDRFAAKPRLRITYLISSILGATGGNMTLLYQANALVERGHKVSIVTYTDRPSWLPIKADVIKAIANQPLAAAAPASDVAISTYFLNTHELIPIQAPLKIYFAQGDQYIFEDRRIQSDKAAEERSRKFFEMSRQSYLLPGIKFLPNSRNLANAVEQAYGRKPDAILPVCVDRKIFRPIKKAIVGSRQRFLIVGPDVSGSAIEPLTFKGILDIRQALEILSKQFNHFTAVRMAGSSPEIFRDFPCEYYHLPDDDMKTFLFGAADILIYASHYDSCPRPPLEAMSSGAAVICTDTSGAREYCRDGENCLLVPIKSPQDISIALQRLITNPQLRETIIRGGLATAAARPQQREWDELEALCYRFLEEKNAI